MSGAFKLPLLRQKPDEYGLTDILGVLRVFQIGVAQAENGVGVGMGQIFRPLCGVHIDQLL